MDLRELGWDERREADFAAFRARGWEPARVVNEDKLAYLVVCASGDLPATITGRMRHLHEDNAELPKVGDWVAIAVVPGESKALIHEVTPRRTQITRKVTGRESEAQVLVTNVDVAFVVQAMDETFNARRIERFLVMVHEGGAQPVVVLNKLDLCAKPERLIKTARDIAGDTPVLAVCAKTGKGTGLLRELLGTGRTAVLIGTSGVGKSSLINRLVGEATQPTLEVRERDSKGRHSTTWREMIMCPKGGLVIDTPGMREFHMWTADEGLDETFPDIAALGAACKFRDCTHENEPGCAVSAAVAAGTVPKGRYASFQKLRRELATVEKEKRVHDRKHRSKPRGEDRHWNGEDDGE
jgi:ribosome biogenesis GTPase